MWLLLIVLLLLLAVGGVPSFGFHRYGWGPSGVVGLVVVVLLVLLLLGRLR